MKPEFIKKITKQSENETSKVLNESYLSHKIDN